MSSGIQLIDLRPRFGDVVAFIAAFAIALATVTGAIDVPANSLSAAAITIGWFVLEFAFYAAMFAVAGALVSRMEELQNAIVPINLLLVGRVYAGAVLRTGAKVKLRDAWRAAA